MNSEMDFNVDERATQWAEQFKADDTFTVSDIEELKSHLTDLTEDLIESGMDANEAFAIATSRLGDISSLKEDYAEANSPVIQMRKTIQAMAGILAFFLLYFLMVSSTRLLILLLHQSKADPSQYFWIVLSYVTAFHLGIVALTLFLNFIGRKGIEKLEKLKIKPWHTLVLFSGVLILASIDLWFRGLITAFKFNVDNSNFYSLFDYLDYTFPLVVIVCFVVLYRKFYLTNIHNEAHSREIAMRNLLVVLSGVLVYFFFYFLLHSTARILFTVLQHYVNDPALNIKRASSYILFFQWAFILFTAGLYFLDKNVIKLLTHLRTRPAHTFRMLFVTIFLATLDRIFFPISKYSIITNIEMKTKLMKIFLYSDFTFPFIFCISFLILFHKYYRDNIRIGN